MILSPHSDSEVIIGSETGHIFRANLDKATQISGSGDFVDLLSQHYLIFERTRTFWQHNLSRLRSSCGAGDIFVTI